MGYVVDMTDMSLVDLIDLSHQTLNGQLSMNSDDLLLLFNYLQTRMAIVDVLKKSLNLSSN